MMRVVATDQEEEQVDYHLVQQIPRDLPTFSHKMLCVSNLVKGSMYQKIVGTQGMRNLIFEVEEVIDDSSDPDVWVVYQTEPDLENYHSLKMLLCNVQFDPKQVVKTYQLKHDLFYEILAESDGKM